MTSPLDQIKKLMCGPYAESTPTDIRKPLDPIEKIIARSEGTPSFIEGWQCLACGGFISEDSTPLNKLGGHKPPTACPECDARCKEVNPNL